MLVIVIRNSFLLLSVTIIAFLVLQNYEGPWTAPAQNRGGAHVASPDPAARPVPAEDDGAADGSELFLEADRAGHFYVDAEIDGREIGFLVDTGATMVALSQADAETIGFPIHQLDYSGRANTANGIARYAPVMIDEIAIGDNVIRNVRGVIIDAPMEKSLLGMSFLRKLSGFAVKDDRLVLRW